MNPTDLISSAVLHAACPERPEGELAPLVAPLKALCERFSINTIRRIGAFIAQMAHESQLRAANESLNYSVEALLAKFGRHRISAEGARRLGRKPGEPALSLDRQREIANLIYGGEYGRDNLGNTQPDDGWLFRGTGPMQNTGRGNATKFAAAMGMTLDEALTYMRTIEGGLAAAAWFWSSHGLNELADTPGIADETHKINGGENGIADRDARMQRTIAALLKAEGEHG